MEFIGRGETKEPLPWQRNDDGEDSVIQYSEGSGGGYVQVWTSSSGGGGQSARSQPHSLGGKGGYNGGLQGRHDKVSGGGAGGGITTVSLRNGTAILAAAYGGDGGGDHPYCTALGGLGASLRNEPKDVGGYINFDFASSSSSSSSSDNRNEVDRVESPGEPIIEWLSHDSATFTWSAGSNRRCKELYVQKYIVQLAEGIIESEDADDQVLCLNDDYKLHEHIQRSFDVNQNSTTTLLNLNPSTSYCLHVESFSIEGLSLGVQIG